MSSSSAAVIGSTGLIGSNILSTLLAKPDAFQTIHTITRRSPPVTDARLQSVVEADTSKWASALSSLSPGPPAVVLSALGTTRAAAGGIDAQWKIDHDLNVELARAARAAGVATYVFVSSGGTRGPGSGLVPYSRMKNGVEDALRDLAFDHAVVLKPGVILGHREQPRLAEGLFQTMVRGLGRLSTAAQDVFGQDAQVIARAAVRAAQLAAEGKAPSKYWVVEASEIIRLGRTEWPAEASTAGS